MYEVDAGEAEGSAHLLPLVSSSLRGMFYTEA